VKYGISKSIETGFLAKFSLLELITVGRWNFAFIMKSFYPGNCFNVQHIASLAGTYCMVPYAALKVGFSASSGTGM